MRYAHLATFRRHRGDTDIRNTMRETTQQSVNGRPKATTWISKQTQDYMGMFLMTENVFGSEFWKEDLWIRC